MPLLNPLTTIGEPTPLALWVPQVAVYPVIALPPLLVDGMNATLICPKPGVAVTFVGAVADGMILKLRSTSGAAFQLSLPGWLARMVQTPIVSKVTVLPLTVHTVEVELRLLYATGSVELALALRLKLPLP